MLVEPEPRVAVDAAEIVLELVAAHHGPGRVFAEGDRRLALRVVPRHVVARDRDTLHPGRDDPRLVVQNL